ncbi:uncharacterized protein [Palaemon carinicauda]|uniref:uncharacterized protein n=1 Tax=Palaemon carinicauda TaxID=392227 RepID=UPI0035B675A9
MSLKLGLGATIANVVCAYAPQTGCTKEEKDTFWEEINQELGIIPSRERVIIGGYLNGHLKISKEGIGRVDGGLGMGDDDYPSIAATNRPYGSMGHRQRNRLRWHFVNTSLCRITYRQEKASSSISSSSSSSSSLLQNLVKLE